MKARTTTQALLAIDRRAVTTLPSCLLSAIPLILMCTALFLTAGGSAFAASSTEIGTNYGEMPGAINLVLGFLRGPLAKVIALGGIVVGGMGLTFGDSGGLRTAMLVMVGIGFIMAASSIVAALSGMSVAL